MLYLQTAPKYDIDEFGFKGVLLRDSYQQGREHIYLKPDLHSLIPLNSPYSLFSFAFTKLQTNLKLDSNRSGNRTKILFTV